MANGDGPAVEAPRAEEFEGAQAVEEEISESWRERVVAEALARRQVVVAQVAYRIEEIREVDEVLRAAGHDPASEPQVSIEASGATPLTREEPVGAAEAADEPETAEEPDDERAAPEGAGEQAEPGAEPDPPISGTAHEAARSVRRERGTSGTDRAAAAAERREAVVAYLKEHGPSRKTEVGAALGIPDGSWGTMLPRLWEESRVRKENVVGSGKAGRVAYLALPDQEIPGREDEPEEGGDDPPPEPPSAIELTAAMVRDAIVKTPRFAEELKVFSPAEVAAVIPELPALLASYGSEKNLAEAIIEQLQEFVASGMIERVSQQGNQNRFRYLTAKEAAERQGPVERSTGGGPGPEIQVEDRRRGRVVEGTGKAYRSSDAEVNKFLDECRAVGIIVDGKRGTHIILRNPANGRSTGISSTPSKRGRKDDRAKVRRVLQVAV